MSCTELCRPDTECENLCFAVVFSIRHNFLSWDECQIILNVSAQCGGVTAHSIKYVCFLDILAYGSAAALVFQACFESFRGH